MQKQHITTIVGIIAVLLVAWGAYSLSKAPRQTANVPGSTTTSTSTTDTTTGTATTTGNGLTISDLKIVGSKPGYKAYANSDYSFVFMYPEKNAVVIPVQIPASDKTPLLYRKDGEFAFCVKERKTSMGCAPAVTLGLADGSGHGVSVYVLNNTDVSAYYPKAENYMVVDKEHNYRYEIYYSDTVSTAATDAQNKMRQDLMSEIGASFGLFSL